VDSKGIDRMLRLCLAYYRLAEPGFAALRKNLPSGKFFDPQTLAGSTPFSQIKIPILADGCLMVDSKGIDRMLRLCLAYYRLAEPGFAALRKNLPSGKFFDPQTLTGSIPF